MQMIGDKGCLVIIAESCYWLLLTVYRESTNFLEMINKSQKPHEQHHEYQSREMPERAQSNHLQLNKNCETQYVSVEWWD